MKKRPRPESNREAQRALVSSQLEYHCRTEALIPINATMETIVFNLVSLQKLLWFLWRKKSLRFFCELNRQRISFSVSHGGIKYVNFNGFLKVVVGRLLFFPLKPINIPLPHFFINHSSPSSFKINLLTICHTNKSKHHIYNFIC